MKRLILMLLSLSMLLSMAGCGGGLDLDPDRGGSGGSDGELIYPDDEGDALGYMGDTLRTAFFDMTVDSAYSCFEFDGLTADEGSKFVAAEITLYNYTGNTVPMFDTDFEIWWDEEDEEFEDDAWAFPMAEQTEDGKYMTMSDQQLPVQYELSIRESLTGTLLYQVPEEQKDFFIVYYEVFEDESYGDRFYVRFSAPLAQ